MTDRELLELAAKAAGITGYWVSNFGSGDYYYRGNADGIYHEYPDGGYTVWNPLEDDGDALRLAVRLHISFLSNIIRVEASTIQLTLNGVFIREDTLRQDENVATRRAIVRAAAEIGRAMP